MTTFDLSATRPPLSSPLSPLPSPLDDMGRTRAAPAARGRLDRAAHPQHARLGRKDRLGRRAAKAGQPAARAVKPGDFALLFRALTNVEYYEEALRRYGIDYYLVGGHAFYSQQEIYDLLNLLRAIDSPVRRGEPGRRASQPDVRTLR